MSAPGWNKTGETHREKAAQVVETAEAEPHAELAGRVARNDERSAVATPAERIGSRRGIDGVR